MVQTVAQISNGIDLILSGSRFCKSSLVVSTLVGNDNYHEKSTDLGISTSCSSPEGESYSGEEWLYSLELMDEYSLDGKVGKRLNQMVPIPVSLALPGAILSA